MKHFLGGSGFSLIELLVVIGIISIISAISLTFLFGTQSSKDLNSTAQQIATLLREAQSRSVAQSSSTSWGVHLENSTATAPFYALFFSGNYSTSTVVGHYSLPTDLAYDSSTLASGAAENITFSEITGLSSASTSIRLYVKSTPALSSTISIASSGTVGY